MKAEEVIEEVNSKYEPDMTFEEIRDLITSITCDESLVSEVMINWSAGMRG